MQASTPATPASESLRIAFFTDFYAPQVNGVAVSLRLLAQGLRQAGHEVTVFAPRVRRFRDEEIGVVRLPSVRVMRRPPVYVIVPGTLRASLALGRSRFDIVHMHTPATAGFLAYVSARCNNVPLIYTYHTSIADLTVYLKRLGRTAPAKRAAGLFSTLACNLGDCVVAPSAKVERVLRQQNVRRPIRVIPNGIDLERFSSPSGRGALRQQLGLRPTDRVLVSVGRLDPEKSPDFLLKAFAAIAGRWPCSHLVIAGDGVSRLSLEDQAAATGLGERIHFLGMVNRAEVPALLKDADLFLSASTAETQCLAVVEAIASGLPVVAVNDEALKESIVDGVNGRILPREIEPFAQAVSALLADAGTRQAFGRASLELSRRFSLEKQTAAVVDAYREALAARATLAGDSWPLQGRRSS